MPRITIDKQELEFKPGQTILQVANSAGIAIPQYCYHDGLSIVASCRICLAEVWAPNPRANNKLEYLGKLLPTCQTTCTDGMVVYTDSPRSIANQKAVMEYLLINHPLDCPVCDQAGECFLQDYSYEYGRGVSRFQESKVKQPKKDLGPHVYLYADRCIMCSRCVRFTREVTGTAEIMVEGRGDRTQIDVFPGVALDNELASNVIDLCPVGALLDKDFLFAQRVWFLKETPSIDGITASGDNIRIDHNEGKVYRVKPRTNLQVNKWWISDEIRYGWKFVHREDRLRMPTIVQHGRRVECDWARALHTAVEGLRSATAGARSLGLLISPMLSCEDAFLLANFARTLDDHPAFAIGPIPHHGQDKAFPGGYTVYAEKCPNARGVRRILEAISGGRPVLSAEQFLSHLGEFAGVILTGNYPSEWVTQVFADAMARPAGNLGKRFSVLMDTLPNRLTGRPDEPGGADVVLPAAAWVEKAGTFENAKGRLQAFEQAIPPYSLSKGEGQIALDLQAILEGSAAPAPEALAITLDAVPGQVPGAVEIAPPIGGLFNAAEVRRRMADPARGGAAALSVFLSNVHLPPGVVQQQPDMEIVAL